MLTLHRHWCTAGGGLLGIAHVGFVCILEKAGVRFRGIGGTSAGAINAIIIAATRNDPTQESWEDTLEASRPSPVVCDTAAGTASCRAAG
jgi:predicted acylesterase/phospholipase RssA